MLRLISFALTLVFSLSFYSVPQAEGRFGALIVNTKIESDTKSGIRNEIVVVGTDFGGVTDSVGRYVCDSIPIGSYTVKAGFSIFGVQTQENVMIAAGKTTRLDFTFVDCWKLRGNNYHAGYDRGVHDAISEVASGKHRLVVDTSELMFRHQGTPKTFPDISGHFCAEIQLDPCSLTTFNKGYADGHDSTALKLYADAGFDLEDTLNCRRYQATLAELCKLEPLHEHVYLSDNIPDISPALAGADAVRFPILNYGASLDSLSREQVIGVLPLQLAELAHHSDLRYLSLDPTDDYLVFRMIPGNTPDTLYFILDLLDGSVYPKTCFAQPD